jgi:hypothetical protein
MNKKLIKIIVIIILLTSIGTMSSIGLGTAEHINILANTP